MARHLGESASQRISLSLSLQEGIIMTNQVAIWIDHKEARIFHVHRDNVAAETVMAPLHHIHNKHPRGPEGAKEHPDDAKRFFHEVVRAVDKSEQILIVGPSTAKLEFSRYLHKHDPAVEAKVVGIETTDHPTDGQLAAYAKKYFELPVHGS
jgi:stalled ribosome rescue protein Dom34